MKFKESFSIASNFSFKLATTDDKKTISKDIPANKVDRIEISIKILKKILFLI